MCILHNVYEIIEKLEHKKTLSGKDYRILYMLSCHFDSYIRSNAAILLCDHYTKMTEWTLLRMTYDKDELVRLEATDSLCIGKTLRTLKRLIKMTDAKDRLIRAYAYLSLIDVLKNRNKSNECERYFPWIRKRVEREKSFKVRFMVMSQLYQEGYREYWQEIIRMIQYQIKRGIKDFWLIMNVMEEIYMENHEKEWNDVLNELSRCVTYENQKKRVLQVIRGKKV